MSENCTHFNNENIKYRFIYFCKIDVYVSVTTKDKLQNTFPFHL